MWLEAVLQSKPTLAAAQLWKDKNAARSKATDMIQLSLIYWSSRTENNFKQTVIKASQIALLPY